MKKLLYYVDHRKGSPFLYWLEKLRLKDKAASVVITLRLNRLEEGLLGDFKSVGKGVLELRISYGPGYRIYFAIVGKEIILLLAGGNKSSQQEDITKAQEYLREYKSHAS